MRKTAPFFIVLLLLGLCWSCTPHAKTTRTNHIVVGVVADFDYLNPLLIQLSLSREVCTMIFPTLVKPSFDEGTGTIAFLPSAASRWEFSPDGKTATFHLRPDLLWEDGKKLTSLDFRFSYTLYADPLVASTRQHYLNDLLQRPDGSIDIERAVETPDDTTLVLHFTKPMAPQIVLDHFNDLMPVAEHLFKTIPPAEIRSRASSIPIIGAGPFKVTQWARQSKLVLASSETSKLPHPATTKTMTFLVVPEYTTRLAMLKSGQIDALISAGGITPKDAVELDRSNPDLSIKPVRNRYFDSIVWLNIDGELFRKNKTVKPNSYFGDRRVRQAMTYAIDRQAIIDGFMGPQHATVVNTPLSPAYGALLDHSLHDYAFNPDKALALLAEAGWKPGPDGILQKNGMKFSFTLAAPVGNPRRNYAATIIQQNLREIGIDCRLRFDENLIFLRSQNEFRYDAALSGMAAETLPFQLIIWGSDFARRPFNSSAFQNARLDTVIDDLSKPLSSEKELALWKTYQQILHEEQPRTFLYYYDELEGFSRRLSNVKVSLLSTLYNPYDWKLE